MNYIIKNTLKLCVVGLCLWFVPHSSLARWQPPEVSHAKAAEGCKSIFDGTTLDHWKSPGMSFWSVEDGAITGQATGGHLPPENNFITWQGGTVADFELKFKFRMFGEKANSGMQFRSQVHERGLVHGYQADITKQGNSMGGIWDEYGPRNSLAARGEKVVIDESGKKTITHFADPGILMKIIDLEKWNEYEVIARGAHIILKINGKLRSELTDLEKGNAASSGVLATPIIPEPMKVQYKEIVLRRFP